ncbi:MAG: MaoC/PaaZ C-terminal domain-containing protein [Alphaproteobacteria bacterium]
MPFPAASAGLRLEPYTRQITVRDILAYAAGLGASEAAFLDDARPGGVLALPFQCVSLEWPVVLSLRDTLTGALTPAEALRGVHAIQDSEFHRPIRPGDSLITEGQLISARRSRAGVVCVIRLAIRDAKTGEAVTTSWSSSIYRGVDLEGDDISLMSPPSPPEGASVALPTDAEVTIVPIPREMPHVYSECAAIWNPIHTERQVALAAGLPDIILHGTATWALAGLTILRRYAGSGSARLKRFSGRFSSMVIPGEPITIRHAPVNRGADIILFEVLTPSGAIAIAQGFAELSEG